MRYKAVIFDLFGTLVDSSSFADIKEMLLGMARALGVGEESFLKSWMGETRRKRSTGEFQSIEECCEYICRKENVPIDRKKLKKAVEVRLCFTRKALTPRKEALLVLKRLRELGLRCGLISDCSPDVPLLWPETALYPLIDFALFSCKAGTTKPDPRMYLEVCKQLRVTPRQCLYVGDGDSEELTGACNVGMDAVMIRVPYDKGHRVREDRWEGPRIQSLMGVLDIVEGRLSVKA